MRSRLIITIHIFLFIILPTYGQDRDEEFLEVRKQSKNYDLPLEERYKYAVEALEMAKTKNIDSLILSTRKTLSLVYLDQENYDLYTDLNRQNLIQAKQLKDTLSIASAYLNLGQSNYFQYENDSAYYYFSKSLKLYQVLEDKDQQGFLFSAISDIQEIEQDYIGSEESAIRAIKIFENLPNNEYNLSQLWKLNNVLGVISLKLGLFDKSLEYHTKAEEISNEMVNGFYDKIYSINNKAFVYRKKGNYEEALKLYSDLASIRSQYDDYDPTFYPLVISNLSFTKLLAGFEDYGEMERLFKEAYHISKKVNDEVTELQVSIDLSKFYFHQKQQDSSLKYANASYKISKKISSNEILLEALKILSELKDGEEGKKYLHEHIKISDSLVNIERSARNKFGRIKYDTDQLEEANVRMTQQRMWLLIVSAVLLVTLFLLYIIITQRAKNKELKFEKDQQKANEEIYNLMLSQQDKVDEARANEKKRISQEMHDGILGRLFGTRLSLDSLNFSEGKEAVQNRSNYISELKIIEDDIRKISHDLNTDFVSGSGFMDIVSELIEKQTNAYKLKHEFNYTDDVSWEIVSNKNKINIYRIIQESLQNIYKHAKAEAVKISFQLKNNVILLSITDDGAGFDVNKSKKGIGIKNINARVNDLEGSVDFISRINEGTTINIKIPYKTNP